MKKLFGIILIVLLVLFAFTDCVDGGAGGNDNNGGSDETLQKENTKMFITVNGNKLEVELADNQSADALIERLKQGDITYTADDYGGFEKVGSLGFGLPRNDTHITAQAGDVFLYSGSQIVLFYGSNSYSYTRLGKINGYSADELRSLLGAGEGSVQVTLSLD